MNWIAYTSRNKEQILADVIAYLRSTSSDISDVSLGNPLIRSALIYAAIGESINYNVDVAAQEGIASTSRTYRSAIAHARLANYRVKNSVAASMDVTFKISQAASTPIIIPSQTMLMASGLRFYTVSSCTIGVGETTASISAIESLTDESVTAISTGESSQAFFLSNSASDNTLTALINSELWQRVENFAFSLSTDKHFIQTIGIEGRPVCLFGDGVNGLVPVAGAVIELSYKRCSGPTGNVTPYSITAIDGSITLPVNTTISAFNIAASSGGIGIESAASIRRNIPNALLTVDRAVTSQDFEAISEMVGGVSRAGVKTECGRTLEVYIVPQGGGLASAQLKTDVLNYLSTRKILGRKILVLSAGVVRVRLELNLRLGATSQPQTVISAVKSNLASKFSYLNQRINSTIYLSDITEIVETTRGVNSSDIVLMNATPYARPMNIQQNLDWSVLVGVDSTSVAIWQIVFLANAKFQLFRNSTFLGQFDVGALVQKYGVSFTINSDISVGAKFEFTSYRNVGNLVLSEMSVPVITEEDITINLL